jgi:hypothetical protein
MKHAIKTAPVPGVIYGNRDFFPDHLVTEARRDIAQVFARLGIGANPWQGGPPTIMSTVEANLPISDLQFESTSFISCASTGREPFVSVKPDADRAVDFSVTSQILKKCPPIARQLFLPAEIRPQERTEWIYRHNPRQRPPG